ncbi:MAG: hypothetical protein QNI87_00890 [Erythrobacter sp.]|uniref:hypothetical protein n=1 Tax=Erythrobacter sp. TaxID=1042 RepID=UPI0026102BC0|nr:hypothetical protein [Erythrobacter sp.]MDJ0977073.1 hypothetical protein [Erythrobacter sp.]
MIHKAKFTAFQGLPAKIGGALACACAVTACAGSSADYPSFALPTMSEQTATGTRVTARFPTVAVPAMPDLDAGQEAMPREIGARLAAIDARAQTAGAAFTANVEPTRALVRAASGTSAESRRRADAEVRFADLTAHHNEGQLALADLDWLAARVAQAAPASSEASSGTETGTGQGDLASIAETQTILLQELERQARILAQLGAELSR